MASLVVDSTPLLVGQDPTLPAAGWGSFPMVPWAGRIRRGRFRFEGVDHQLPINFEQHAIHGTGFEQSWRIDDHDGTRCSLSCNLAWGLRTLGHHREALQFQPFGETICKSLFGIPSVVDKQIDCRYAFLPSKRDARFQLIPLCCGLL